ncbi:MAG: MotA/TolQ/ExbB proton channel family protein [Planctomycetes bacterium]|nr:MotA/TolQ/ExbB proton channel family protein [Planctomycetota bacterium]
MQSLQDLLAFLADALLLPVFAGLLLLLAFALVSAGSFVREYLLRERSATDRRLRIAGLAAGDRELAAAELDRLEMRFARIVDRGALAARLAPMFGLAGTLIPLGPGLREMNAGNLQGLGAQLAVAFSTTVAGLAASGVCFAISSIRSRWYENELRKLEAAAARRSE